MYITKIIPDNGKKYLVFGDDEFLFALYSSELKRFGIREEVNIDEEIISSIMDEIIYKRGKERALYLLEKRPLSEKMLRDKLRDNSYNDAMVERIVKFLYRYRYLDDMEYIRMYVETYRSKKSMKKIRYDLIAKGISKNDLDLFFESNQYDDELSFKALFDKYVRGKDLKDRITRQKVYRYFYGKGFSSSMIEHALHFYDEV